MDAQRMYILRRVGSLQTNLPVVYSCGVYNDMLDLDLFTPLEEVTQKSFINQPQMPFLTQQAMHYRRDVERQDTRRSLHDEITQGICT